MVELTNEVKDMPKKGSAVVNDIQRSLSTMRAVTGKEYKTLRIYPKQFQILKDAVISARGDRPKPKRWQLAINGTLLIVDKSA